MPREGVKLVTKLYLLTICRTMLANRTLHIGREPCDVIPGCPLIGQRPWCDGYTTPTAWPTSLCPHWEAGRGGRLMGRQVGVGVLFAAKHGETEADGCFMGMKSDTLIRMEH